MRVFAALGAILAVIGAVLGVASFIPIVGSTTWLDESFVVPEFRHYYHTSTSQITFRTGVTLHMSFNVTQGSSIDFYVMNEDNYEKMNASLAFQYYVQPSRSSISRIDIDWSAPASERIYFVWDNSASYVPKSISAEFSIAEKSNLLPSGAVFVGLALVFGGIGTVRYGMNTTIPSSSRPMIIAGYVLSALGGLLGIVIGLDLRSHSDQAESFHGKSIVSIGAASALMYVLIVILEYGFL